MDSVEQVMKGLTPYEREACKGRILYIAKRDVLVAKGILSARRGSNWTPLGLEVRARLLSSGGEG